MTCLGLIKNKNFKFRRCKRPVKRFFCDDHSRQPLGWLFVGVVTGGGFVFTVVGGTASILSYLRNDRVPVAEQKVQPASSPPVVPSSMASVTPNFKTPDSSNRNSLRESAQSFHVRRASVLFDQAKYHEALAECDAELRVNPHNKEALNLRKRILGTIQILKDH